MPFSHRSRQPVTQFNMTPMIDVVFLLIIFFLVSSHLAQQETQLELALPTAQSGHDEHNTTWPRVTINVLSDGRVYLGSNATGPKELVQRLRVERERTQEDLEIRIRSDRSVPYGIVEPILVACARANIWNVTFAVLKEGQGQSVP